MPRIQLDGTTDVYFATGDDILWLAKALNRLKARYGSEEALTIMRDAISYAIRAEGKATGRAMIRYLTKNHLHVVGRRHVVVTVAKYDIEAVLDGLS